MLRFESSRKANGSHSPLGMRIRIIDSSTTETGRRQIDRRMSLGAFCTIPVTSSIVLHGQPSTPLMTSPCTSVPSRSAGPPVVMAPTVTSPSHRSTAIPSVPLPTSRMISTSKYSSFLTAWLEDAFSSDMVPSMPPPATFSAAASFCASVSASVRFAFEAASKNEGRRVVLPARPRGDARVASTIGCEPNTFESLRLRSSFCFAALRASFSAISAATRASASAISAATRASASALAFATAAATAFSSAFFLLADASASALRRASASASRIAFSSASFLVRSAASRLSRSCRSVDHFWYSRRALSVRIRCCARAAAALFSLYRLRRNQP
mmetsp:Transcript_13329/g.44476  ORF Transcript_13329/g.44476 Transcript_13329/m.44476 type:complete len:328 (+) Transcript_13329:2066-3049(+)